VEVQTVTHKVCTFLAHSAPDGLDRHRLRRRGHKGTTPAPREAGQRRFLPLLERAESAGGDMMLAPRGQQQLICSLATTALANQLLPRVLWGIIAALADGQQPAQPEERSLSQLSPILSVPAPRPQRSST